MFVATNKLFIPSNLMFVMKKNLPSSIIGIVLLLLAVACNNSYQSQSIQYNSYSITNKQPKDSTLIKLLQPYTNTVNATMNSVVGYADKTLDKKQPEGTLGNFMADVFYTMAAEKYNTKVDVAFFNFGGIRLTQLPAGNVTKGKVFELMPFDNLLILQKLKGTVLQQVLDHIAMLGGWPISGMTMEIKNKKAVNVKIGGKNIDMDAMYVTVNSDFIANGGDNADMLRPIPQISNGYLMRDALFDYINKLTKEGKNISANIENRIINAQ